MNSTIDPLLKFSYVGFTVTFTVAHERSDAILHDLHAIIAYDVRMNATTTLCLSAGDPISVPGQGSGRARSDLPMVPCL